MESHQNASSKDSQLSKRRRFAPNMLSAVAAGNDSPLLHNYCDPPPSEQEIEAQLLQVGMRIRKSVNDGYQTGRRAFTPRPFFNSSRLSPDTISALSNTTETSTDFSAGGLHNVGGLAMQPIGTATFCGISLAAMAHVSTTPVIEEQKLWSYSTASKRRQHFDEDSDSDDSQDFMPKTPQLEYADAGMAIPQDYFNINFDGITEISPVAPVEEAPRRSNNRKIAQPRSRMRQIPQEPLPVINPFAQIVPNAPVPSVFGHQRMRSCGMEAMDFGEALFLQPRQDVEMDCS